MTKKTKKRSSDRARRLKIAMARMQRLNVARWDPFLDSVSEKKRLDRLIVKSGRLIGLIKYGHKKGKPL